VRRAPERAVAWNRQQGIAVERVLCDNTKAYYSHLWRQTCPKLGIARRYTRPFHHGQTEKPKP
jgi:hypothetical protein